MIKRFLILSSVAVCCLTVSAQTTILQEDFQQGIPSTWTIVINDTNTVNSAVSEYAPGWIAVTDPTNPLDTIAAATSFFQYAGLANRWLISPPLTLSSFGNAFSWDAKSHDPSFPDDYKIMVSTSDNQITSFTDTIGIIQEEYETWTTRNGNLSELGYNNQTIYIAFVLNSYDAFKLYINNFNVSVDDPASIGENVMVNWSLYPNPVAQSLTLQSETPISLYEIYSLAGEQLTVENVNSISVKLNVSALKQGSYFIRVKTEQGIATKKFIKL
jgi:hypothetical protein